MNDVPSETNVEFMRRLYQERAIKGDKKRSFSKGSCFNNAPALFTQLAKSVHTSGRNYYRRENNVADLFVAVIEKIIENFRQSGVNLDECRDKLDSVFMKRTRQRTNCAGEARMQVHRAP